MGIEMEWTWANKLDRDSNCVPFESIRCHTTPQPRPAA